MYKKKILIMSSKSLHEFRAHCTQLQDCCHKTVNRVMSKMVEHPQFARHLELYGKKCLVVEKMCEYITWCCCYEDKVSDMMRKEYHRQCGMLMECCDKLMSVMPKKEAEYIRCGGIKKLCSGKSSKKSSRKSSSKKSMKRSKSAKKSSRKSSKK